MFQLNQSQLLHKILSKRFTRGTRDNILTLPLFQKFLALSLFSGAFISENCISKYSWDSKWFCFFWGHILITNLTAVGFLVDPRYHRYLECKSASVWPKCLSCNHSDKILYSFNIWFDWRKISVETLHDLIQNFSQIRRCDSKCNLYPRYQVY